ncbi:MAG TPA: site-2 protease family protein, partial [bacterium]
LGDNTAKQMNRLTLNPLAHLDPIGTLLLFVAHFGWAKPVPVNPYNFRNPTKDMGIVAIAGPGSNLLQAVIFGIIIRIFFAIGSVPGASFGQFVIAFSILALQINLALCFFNLLPIFPLDGSRILRWVLPPRYHNNIEWLERYGPIILIMVFAFEWVVNVPVFSYILFIPIKIATNIITGMPSSTLMYLYRSALYGG